MQAGGGAARQALPVRRASGARLLPLGWSVALSEGMGAYRAVLAFYAARRGALFWVRARTRAGCSGSEERAGDDSYREADSDDWGLEGIAGGSDDMYVYEDADSNPQDGRGWCGWI